MVKLVDGGIYIARNGERVKVVERLPHIEGRLHSFEGSNGFYYTANGFLFSHETLQEQQQDLIAEWKPQDDADEPITKTVHWTNPPAICHPAPDLDRMRWEAALAALTGLVVSNRMDCMNGTQDADNYALDAFTIADAMLVAGGYKPEKSKESEEE